MTTLRFFILSLVLLTVECFAQISSVQPFFLQSSVSGNGDYSPTNIPRLAYWWVASDLPQGTVVTGWVDRIQSARLTNNIPANRPTVTSNAVVFANTCLSNTLPSPIFSSHSFFVIYSCAWDGLNSRETLLGHNGSSYSGYSFNCLSAATIRYDLATPGWDITYLSNSLTADIAIGDQNTRVIYTNAVAGQSYNQGNISWPAYLSIGNARDQGYPWAGSVMEVMVYTNTILSSVNVSNLHYHATNLYKYYP